MDANIKRLDHLGIVKGTIDELGIIEAIDDCFPSDGREDITVGEAVAGMILNGLGFSSRPLSLSPMFFKNKALETLFNKKINAESFNISKLSRVLDKLHHYGLERLFLILSSKACGIAKIDNMVKSLDTTTLSLHGEYDNELDEQTINVAHGYSKDHRPDLKQIVHELVVSQDGGVPLMMKTWDGNSSDNKIFKERSKEVINNLSKLELKNNFLVADSKLYCVENAENLSRINYITRIPNSISIVRTKIDEAMGNTSGWSEYNDELSYKTFIVEHYGMTQRWIVCKSKSSLSRANKFITKSIRAEEEKLKIEKNKCMKTKHCSESDAIKHLESLKKKIKLHDIVNTKLYSKGYYNSKGKPKKNAVPDYYAYHIDFDYELNSSSVEVQKNHKSCFIIGTNSNNEQKTDKKIVETYKNQNSSIENKGFRFLKDPYFFTSSLFVKKPSRIESMVFIMTLALLVYSIAQKTLRDKLKATETTIPGQNKKETDNPTMRWVFQLFEGIHSVTLYIQDKLTSFIQGISEQIKKIINTMGGKIKDIYERNEIGLLGT